MKSAKLIKRRLTEQAAKLQEKLTKVQQELLALEQAAEAAAPVPIVA
jgi:DNA-binding protein YbaB